MVQFWWPPALPAFPADSSSPLNCVPQKDFDATPHLEAEVLFREVKGCTSSSVYNARAAHIVHLLHKPRYWGGGQDLLWAPKRGLMLD